MLFFVSGTTVFAWASVVSGSAREMMRRLGASLVVWMKAVLPIVPRTMYSASLDVFTGRTGAPTLGCIGFPRSA